MSAGNAALRSGGCRWAENSSSALRRRRPEDGALDCGPGRAGARAEAGAAAASSR